MVKANRAHLMIRHKAFECIGCQLCAEMAPDYFFMNEDGMAVLVNGEKRGVFHHAKGLAMDSDALENAAEGCPVDIIRVDKT